MKAKVFVGLAALLLAVQAGRGSDYVGIYARIDKVEVEPSEGQPAERVRVWGVFAVAQGRSGEEYKTPERGFLYFSLPQNKPEQARKEWNDLKKVAGTNDCVAFGARGRVQGLKVRTDKEVTKGAMPYHSEGGVVKVPANNYMAKKLLAFKPQP